MHMLCPRLPLSNGRRPRLLGALCAAVALAIVVASPLAAESRYEGAQTPERAPEAVVDGLGRPIPLSEGPVFFLPPDVQIDLTPTRNGLPGVPLACLALVPVRHGAVRLVEAQCLWEAGVDPRALPGQCVVTVQVHGGIVQGFDPTCLGAAGYRLAGR